MPPNPFDDRPFRVRTKLAITYGLLMAANVAAWAWALIAFHGQPVLLGTAFLAYMFGLRHAFDADHIAAIDNVVRKLMQDKKSPYSVGFFFSLGHSSIVVIASLAIAGTAATVQSELDIFHNAGGAIGTAISALFMLLIAGANLIILKGAWRTFTRIRLGERPLDADLEALPSGHGMVTRLFGRLFGLVSHSWHMYPIGFLFGLGFDTATEIGLLGISAAQAAVGMSIWVILVFPALFTAAMSLMDTTDSALMTHVYGWALVDPMRKLWYNLTITTISVVIALFIGSIEAVDFIGDKIATKSIFWTVASALNNNMEFFGLLIVAIFITSWLISAVVFRPRLPR